MVTTRSMINSLQTAVLPKKIKRTQKESLAKDIDVNIFPLLEQTVKFLKGILRRVLRLKIITFVNNWRMFKILLYFSSYRLKLLFSNYNSKIRRWKNRSVLFNNNWRSRTWSRRGFRKKHGRNK